MKGNIGIPALVVLLAACSAPHELLAQQPAAPTAQKPAVQQPAPQVVRRVPKDPFAARLSNASPAPTTTAPASAVKPNPDTHAATSQPPANPAAAPAPAATPVGPPTPPAPDAPTLKVVCSGGQITITANNTTLGNVLNEVKRCSGAQVDAPTNSYSTRIFDSLGPGPIREVLESLLDDTGFDYVIGASDTNPDKIESILLMARNTEPGAIGGNDTVELGNSANRKAFAQRREASRPHPPEEQAQAIAAIEDAEKPPAAAGASTATNGAPAPANPADPNAAPNSTLDGGSTGTPAQQQNPAPSSDTAASPSPTDASAPSPSDNTTSGETRQPTTDEQITNMEQLFQQRQKMMQPPTPPKPQ